MKGFLSIEENWSGCELLYVLIVHFAAQITSFYYISASFYLLLFITYQFVAFMS